MESLLGKVALITGASSGIGAGTTERFAALGCKLSITGRNSENLDNVIEECLKAGSNSSNIHKVVGDVSKEDDLKLILQSTIDYFGKLDILVNNAGILLTGSVEEANLESYDDVMNVNWWTRLTGLSFHYVIHTSIPGTIITEVLKRGGMSEADYAKYLEHCKETHALGRPGKVEEVAQAIAFFANDVTSSFITGVNLAIDGGRAVMCPR